MYRFAMIFKKTGFTLIEFLIVIGLIVVIAFFSWQAFSRLGSGQELKNTTSSIVALLRDAQQRSITQVDSRSWGVRFEGDHYFLFSTDQSLASPITSWATSTLITLKPVVKFNQPTSSSTIAFWQIGGELASVDCPEATTKEIEVGLKDGEETSIIKVFCNGRIQY